MKTVIIGVYGSLKKDKHNHHMLDEAVSLGEDTLRGHLYSNGSYPALEIAAAAGKTVPIELYEISEEAFTRINSMELNAGYTKQRSVSPVLRTHFYYWPASQELLEYIKSSARWQKVESY